MIHPGGTFKVRWDVLMLAQLLYVCLAAPYIICFAVEYPTASVLGIIDAIIYLTFALDLLINFRLGMTLGKPALEAESA
jgi:hypothetical protein